VRERINIYGYMLWMAALAIVLLRAPVETAQDSLGAEKRRSHHDYMSHIIYSIHL